MQTVCFVGTLEADVATKIIIKIFIVITPQHLSKKISLSILGKKILRTKKKKNMN